MKRFFTATGDNGTVSPGTFRNRVLEPIRKGVGPFGGESVFMGFTVSPERVRPLFG